MERPKRRRVHAFVLPLGLLAASGFAAAEVAGCFDALDDCSNTLYFGPACSGSGSASGTTGSHSGSGSGSGSGSSGSGSSGSGTGAGGTSSSSTTASGTGGKPECTKASDCQPVPAGPCASLGVPTCKGGKCGVEYTAGPAPSQVYGNCQENFCDTTGSESSLVDGGNVYDDGNPCDQYTCTVAGTPQYMPKVGAPCMTQGICELNPDNSNANLTLCFGCDPNSPTACSPGLTVCVGQGKCAPLHCADKSQDTGETDVDCGGVCPPCQVGQKCSVYSDCYTQVCAAPDGGLPTCQTPTCSDGRQNGTETDVDCGGLDTCPRCGNTLKCLKATDCQSGVCKPTGIVGTGMPNTCQPPSCTDGVKNGNETGIDCSGGGGCPPCGDGGT